MQTHKRWLWGGTECVRPGGGSANKPNEIDYLSGGKGWAGAGGELKDQCRNDLESEAELGSGRHEL